jgi:hypothetical protein
MLCVHPFKIYQHAEFDIRTLEPCSLTPALNVLEMG